ncbi:MAG: NMD3-related protein [Candidatus Diapherotrites archaeon]
MKEFCPKCGSKQKPFIKGFCMKCFLESKELIELPKELALEKCPHCSKFKLRNAWVEELWPSIEETVKSKVKALEGKIVSIEVSLKEEREEKITALAKIKMLAEGNPVQLLKEVPIKLSKVLCDPCMKLSSEYHESVIQIRFEREKEGEWLSILEKMHEKLEPLSRKDSLAKITKIEKERKGYDLWIGSKRAGKILAEDLARKFNSKVTYSYTTIGVKDSGKQKKRYTFCVRI